MTLIEAGVMAGIPAGGIIGGMILREGGTLGIVGGSIAGCVLGAVSGFAYSFVVIALCSIIGVLRKAVLQRKDRSLSDLEMDRMSRIGVRGIWMGVIASLASGMKSGWGSSVAVLFGAAIVIAVIAVVRSESG
jgi:hypothetical protein